MNSELYPDIPSILDLLTSVICFVAILTDWMVSFERISFRESSNEPANFWFLRKSFFAPNRIYSAYNV